MTPLTHRGHRPAGRLPQSPPPSASPEAPAAPPTTEDRQVDERVYAVQRLGAAAVASFLAVFGLLGATSGVPFLSTSGEHLLGMSSNGLLSALSLVVAAVLAGAYLRGPHTASTVMIVLGVLFLLAALAGLAVLDTRFNLLAFRAANVLFSFVVGMFLLVLGGYGRISGNLPDTSPYAHPHAVPDELDELPHTPAERAAEAAMRDAEIAVVQHRATEDQRRRVAAMALVHTRADRRRVWQQFDEPGAR